MKILPLVLAVVLAGCGKAVPAQPVYPRDDPFQAVVYLEQEGREGRGLLTRTADGLELLLEEPAQVDGLSFSQQAGEGLTVALGELSCTLPPDSLPPAAPFRILADCLEQGPLLPLEEQEDGTLAADGTCGAGTFRLWVEKETGKFLRLEVLEESFAVQFENVRFSP